MPSLVSLWYKFLAWGAGLEGTFSGDRIESQRRPPLLAWWAFVSCATGKGGPDSGPGKQCQLVTACTWTLPPGCQTSGAAVSWLPGLWCRQGPFSEAGCSAPEWAWRKKSRHTPFHSCTPTRRASVLCLAKGQTHACHTPELWSLILGTAGICCPDWALPGLSGCLASTVK